MALKSTEAAFKPHQDCRKGEGSSPALLLATLAVLVCASEFAYASWNGFEDLSFPMDQIIGNLLLLTILYLFIAFLLLRFSESAGSGFPIIHLVVLSAAVLFRVTVAPAPPLLSDDLYRYRWEGMLQSAGGNPYQAAPVDKNWSPLRDNTYSRIPVRDYPGGYGPLTMLVERGSYASVRGMTQDPFLQAKLMKWPSALGDLGILVLLAGWLRSRGKPTFLAGIYALCPLSVVEFWGMGHNDALAIAALVAAFWAMDARREGVAFLCLGVAIAFKWWPALLLPTFIGISRESPRRLLWAAMGLAVIPLSFLPYWSDITQNARFMGGFAGGWRNNDSLFGITFALSGGEYETAKWWTLAMIGTLAVLGGVLIRRREHAALVVLAGTLLLSANCHPWYLLWFVPLLVFAPWPPLLLWISLSPLFYEVLIDYQILGVWEGSRPGRWLVYVPFFALALAYGAWGMLQRRRRQDGPSSSTAVTGKT